MAEAKLGKSPNELSQQRFAVKEINFPLEYQFSKFKPWNI